jgi:hypothetical protein
MDIIFSPVEVQAVATNVVRSYKSLFPYRSKDTAAPSAG